MHRKDALGTSVPNDGSVRGDLYVLPSDIEAATQADQEVSSRVAEYMYVTLLREFYVNVAKTKRNDKPPVVLYMSVEVEHLTRTIEVPVGSDGRYMFLNLTNAPEKLHRQIEHKLLQTGTRDAWWDQNMHPIMHRALSDDEIQYLSGGPSRQLITNLSDVDFVTGFIAGGRHYRSLVMANPGNIGANANGIQCKRTGLAQFALVVGDSQVPTGEVATIWGDKNVQRVLIALVREACMAWNYRTGLIGTREGCTQHIDYTDSTLMSKIAFENLSGLECHKQGVNMCAFQASLHCRAVLERVLQDFRRGTDLSNCWPAGNPLATPVGLRNNDAIRYRQGIAQELRTAELGL